jgi:17beta-estradiol 17-dehydrogenase / very-long-chain 3-oxoacyl-CoA reductase
MCYGCPDVLSTNSIMFLFDFVVYLGMCQVAVWVYRLIIIFKNAFSGIKATPERYGADSWAIVTGCTDGIGLECAKHLVRQGFNIVLVSRSLDKLNAKAKEFQELGKSLGKNTLTRVIAIDFTEPKYQEANTWEKIYKDCLDDLDISILVNNAGLAASDYFTWIPEKDIHGMLTCNMNGVVALTQQVVKVFKKRYIKSGKRSLLTFTSSQSSFGPAPFGQVYGATKTFLNALVPALAAELAEFRVDVSAWTPGEVSTKLLNYRKSSTSVLPS